MWKAKLNRHFAKLTPAFKISIFLIFWNGLFHSFTLAILLLWSLTSNRVSALNRMTTLNQFLSENKILFATLSSLSALVFFKDTVSELWRSRRSGFPEWLKASLRGFGFGALMIAALILNHDYDFLGLSTQVNLNFLASYAWIFRAALILGFIFSTEFLVRVILRRELHTPRSQLVLENLTLLGIYAIWFSPKPGEVLTLVLFFLFSRSFWSSSGFLSAFFVLTHAILGLHFFENETVGIFQLKSNQPETSLLQNSHLRIMLILLLLLIHYAKVRLRKESRTT
ncbi:MAG: hypothetical protein KGP28_11455 [Bdellovibrionales bacterium]|nr:hypothetical protein [Bdellovibrionales bacterium]